MQTANLEDREGVLLRTDEFIGALESTRVVRRFKEAARRFEEDQEVQSLVQTFRRFQQAQQNGGVLGNELRDVRDAQARIQKHRVVQEFLESREAAGEFLQKTNGAISEVLGVDFGRTAGPAGGAC